MRDNELKKDFVLDKEMFTMYVNDIVIDAKSLASHPIFTVNNKNCFCVCFSEKKDDEELFKRFKANVCIAIDIDEFVIFLERMKVNFKGIGIVHGPVIYYPPVMKSAGPKLDSVLFYKRDVYLVEAEYRVALTVPPNVTHFLDDDGGSLPIFAIDPKDARHFQVKSGSADINKSFIKGFTCWN